MRTYFILLLATALLAPGATVAQTPGTGNGLELDDGGCSNAGGGTAVIAIGATAAVALGGALIGAPLRKWHTVYQAR